MVKEQIELLQRALDRERAARKEAEKILEEKSLQLFNSSTEIKEMNERLQALLEEKTDQLKGVYENISDAYLVMGLSGNVLKMNDTAKNLFGYDIKKEPLNVISLIYKADYKYAMDSYAALVKKGIFTNYKARVITKKKTVKWVHISASLIYNKDKKPIAAQGIIRDITAARQSAELIKSQKEQLDIIIDNSSVGIVLVELENIIKTNKTIQEALGYSEKELTRLTIDDISFDDDDFTEVKYKMAKMEAGEIDYYELVRRYKKKNGSALWAKTNVNAVRDSQGKLKYHVKLIEDITVRREKDLIIEIINDVAKALLGKIDIHEIAWEVADNIAEYLGSVDCVIYLVNHKEQTLEQIAAYGNKINSDGHIINKKIHPIGKGITGTVAKTGIPEIITDTSKDSRYIVDDKKRLSEITVPIISDGQVIGIIDSEHDEKNYYTKEHLQTLENIANLVAIELKSAINLREREKIEARNTMLLKKLEKSNTELQEYAHVVSHDLKSPLRSINALTTWIKEDNKDKLDDASQQNIHLIQATIEKMEDLISGILMYSSIGAESDETENVDLNDVLEELEQMLFFPKHIKFSVLNKLPVINGDRTKLMQLFQNIISNAIKFCDKDESFIEVDVADRGTAYEFSIKDNGIGIEKKYHEKIFKIFNSLKKSKESTGIGLSIVKKIVDLHKGEIWIESEVKIGTTFYFTLKKTTHENNSIKKT